LKPRKILPICSVAKRGSAPCGEAEQGHA